MILNTELEYKGNLFPSNIISYKKNLDTLSFTSENNVVLQITVQRDSILRFRYSTTGVFEKDFSYAITKYASRGYNFLEITEEDDKYIITTSKIIFWATTTAPAPPTTALGARSFPNIAPGRRNSACRPSSPRQSIS